MLVELLIAMTFLVVAIGALLSVYTSSLLSAPARKHRGQRPHPRRQAARAVQHASRTRRSSSTRRRSRGGSDPYVTAHSADSTIPPSTGQVTGAAGASCTSVTTPQAELRDPDRSPGRTAAPIASTPTSSAAQPNSGYTSRAVKAVTVVVRTMTGSACGSIKARAFSGVRPLQPAAAELDAGQLLVARLCSRRYKSARGHGRPPDRGVRRRSTRPRRRSCSPSSRPRRMRRWDAADARRHGHRAVARAARHTVWARGGCSRSARSAATRRCRWRRVSRPAGASTPASSIRPAPRWRAATSPGARMPTGSRFTSGRRSSRSRRSRASSTSSSSTPTSRTTPNYIEAVLPRLSERGLIAVDNTLWSGEVLDPQDDNPRAIADLNDRLAADHRVVVAAHRPRRSHPDPPGHVHL